MNNKEVLFDQALPGMLPMLEIAFYQGLEQGITLGQKQGFAEGLEVGKLLGFIAGVNSMTPAVSDGLRHGSPQCGKAMQALKNLGLDTTLDVSEK